MAEKSNLYIVAIVGVVAVVAIVIMVASVGTTHKIYSSSNTITAGDSAGQVVAAMGIGGCIKFHFTRDSNCYWDFGHGMCLCGGSSKSSGSNPSGLVDSNVNPDYGTYG